MLFVSQEVSFPATRNQRSRVAGNGTECEVKTIELSSPASGGEQRAFLNLHNFTAVKKIAPKLRKHLYLHIRHLSNCDQKGAKTWIDACISLEKVQMFMKKTISE